MPETISSPPLPPDGSPDPVTVHIPSVGVVQFPHTMSMNDVTKAARKIHEQHNVHVFPGEIATPQLDTDEQNPKSDLPDITVGKTPGRKQFANPDNVKPLLDTESPVRKIPPAGRSLGFMDGGPIVGGPEATEALAERGQMREGWDSNPSDRDATERLMNDKPAWIEEDYNNAPGRGVLRTIGAKPENAMGVLDKALQDYDKAPQSAKPKMEKQIFQKMIDYRRYAKGMDGSEREGMDKKIARYSNSLAKKK